MSLKQKLEMPFKCQMHNGVINAICVTLGGLISKHRPPSYNGHRTSIKIEDVRVMFALTYFSCPSILDSNNCLLAIKYKSI